MGNTLIACFVAAFAAPAHGKPVDLCDHVGVSTTFTFVGERGAS